jgi:hypothetical protein
MLRFTSSHVSNISKMFRIENDVSLFVILNPRYEDEGSPSLRVETLLPIFIRISMTYAPIYVIPSPQYFKNIQKSNDTCFHVASAANSLRSLRETCSVTSLVHVIGRHEGSPEVQLSRLNYRKLTLLVKIYFFLDFGRLFSR